MIGVVNKSESNFGIKIIFTLLFFITVCASVGFAWSYAHYHSVKQKIAQFSVEGSEKISNNKLTELIDQVSKHIVLPQNELPSVAIFNGIDLLTLEQKFFEGAQSGDRVLVYSDRVILFSVDRDRIVNVAPVKKTATERITSNEITNEKQLALSEDSVITMEIRNGTTVSGVARKEANALSMYDQYEIIHVSDAKKNDYVGTTLVNMGKKDIQDLERHFSVTAQSTLPDGEEPTFADILIIIGS